MTSEEDRALLARVRAACEAADPLPAGLTDRIRFTLALAGLEEELARIETPAVAVRGEEESRTVTFDSESLTIMIRIDANPDGTVRIDGWLAPPASCLVELRSDGNPLHVHSDSAGRFVFRGVARGTARLAVLPVPDSARTVVTPVLVL